VTHTWYVWVRMYAGQPRRHFTPYGFNSSYPPKPAGNCTGITIAISYPGDFQRTLSTQRNLDIVKSISLPLEYREKSGTWASDISKPESVNTSTYSSQVDGHGRDGKHERLAFASSCLQAGAVYGRFPRSGAATKCNTFTLSPHHMCASSTHHRGLTRKRHCIDRRRRSGEPGVFI